jgi:hypothetical protein
MWSVCSVSYIRRRIQFVLVVISFVSAFRRDAERVVVICRWEQGIYGLSVTRSQDQTGTARGEEKRHTDRQTRPTEARTRLWQIAS